MPQLITPDQVRRMPGQPGVDYMLDRAPYSRYVWNGTRMVQLGSLDLSTLAVASTTIHLWGNPDGSTRTGTFVVPLTMTVLRVLVMVGPGGNAGQGGPLGAGNLTGGGAASSGECLEFAEFPVIPGETIWFQIGGDGTGLPTELRHGSSTGSLLSMTNGRGQVTASVVAGGNGGDGDGTQSGFGAAGTGSGLYGRTPGAQAAAKTTDSAGSNGQNLGGTFSANKFITPMPSKMGGLGGGGGAWTNTATARNGGLGPNHSTVVDGTIGLEGLTGQAAGGVGDTTHAGGGGGPGPISTVLKNGATPGGGTAGFAGNDAFVPGGAGSGGATGFAGGRGRCGHIAISNWPGNALDAAPPAVIAYTGAGLAIPADFVGLHSALDVGRLNTVTGNQSGGKVLLGTDRPVSNNRQGLIFRSGTPPVASDTNQPLALDTLYYVIPFGAAPSNGSYNTVGLSRTENGQQIVTTNAGTSAVGELVDLPASGELDFSLYRSLSCTNLHWAGLHTADNTFSASGTAQLQRLATALRAKGRKMIYTIISTPSWASTNAGGGTNPYGYAGGAFPPIRTAGADGRMPVRQLVNWLVSNFGDVLAAIELWNEPAFPGSGTSYYSGTAADLVQVAVDAKAELVALASNIPLIGPAVSGGSSAADTLRLTTGTLYSFLTAAATVSATLGQNTIDGISLHPYDHTAAPVGPENLPMWRANMTLIVGNARRCMQIAGMASYATFPVWLSEVGFSGTTMETQWPQLDISAAFAGSMICAAAGGARHFNAYNLSTADSRYMSRNDTLQGVVGDVKRRLAGKTLKYAALRHDGVWLTQTAEEGAATWSPRWAAA